MTTTEKPEQIHDAQKVAYSSVVGQSIMLLNKSGACIGQLSVLNTAHPQDVSDQVVAALKAPNRHAYKVGVAVGKSDNAKREQALRDLADLGQEFDRADTCNEAPELLPCPFCGGAAEMNDGVIYGNYVECGVCELTYGVRFGSGGTWNGDFDGPGDARRAWNRRADLAAPQTTAQAAQVRPEAVDALAAYTQGDMDGIMVLVSRQAIEECLPALRALTKLDNTPTEFDPTGTTDVEKLCHSHGFSAGYAAGLGDAERRVDHFYQRRQVTKPEDIRALAQEPSND